MATGVSSCWRVKSRLDARLMAATFADRILRATDRLATLPRSGRVVPEVGREIIREIFVSNYRIIYRVGKGDVHILTIHHGARLPDSMRIGL